ncbi:hypothetical protein GQR58_004939 [Nymphon striatum]|nr:hypothetical protein GQR58_004939 [Nymphon striatum]
MKTNCYSPNCRREICYPNGLRSVHSYVFLLVPFQTDLPLAQHEIVLAIRVKSHDVPEKPLIPIKEGDLQDKIRYIESLSEPQKALAYELKMRCKDMEDNVRSLRSRGLQINSTEESVAMQTFERKQGLLQGSYAWVKVENFEKPETICFHNFQPSLMQLEYGNYIQTLVKESYIQLTLNASHDFNISTKTISMSGTSIKVEKIYKPEYVEKPIIRLKKMDSESFNS